MNEGSRITFHAHPPQCCYGGRALRIFAWLLCATSPLFAADLMFHRDACTNRLIILRPLSLIFPTNEAPVYDVLSARTDTNGVCWFSNIVGGTWSVAVQSPPSTTTWAILVPTNAGPVNIDVCGIAMPQAVSRPTDYSFSADASDKRYATANGGGLNYVPQPASVNLTNWSNLNPATSNQLSGTVLVPDSVGSNKLTADIRVQLAQIGLPLTSALYAGQATNDLLGNPILTTYATVVDLGALSNAWRVGSNALAGAISAGGSNALYAANAGHAAVADVAGGATNDLLGNPILTTYATVVDLGALSNAWRVASNALAGAISSASTNALYALNAGHAQTSDFAGSATNDLLGNPILTTYATLVDLGAQSNAWRIASNALAAAISAGVTNALYALTAGHAQTSDFAGSATNDDLGNHIVTTYATWAALGAESNAWRTASNNLAAAIGGSGNTNAMSVAAGMGILAVTNNGVVTLSLYSPPSIYLLSSSPVSVEMGTTISTTALTWSLTGGPITGQAIDTGSGLQALSDLSQREYVYHESYNTNHTFRLSCTDGTSTTESTTTVHFYRQGYYGVSANSALSDGEIWDIGTREIMYSKSITFTVSPAAQYIYYAYPVDWGEASFNVNGLQNTAWTLITRTFINMSGYSSAYNIYRSNTVLTGTGISVEAY